jgi:tetratricopeptide (TPR) repeat protein
MLKVLMNALFGTGDAERLPTAPQEPVASQPWRRPPMKETRDEIGPLVLTMSYSTGHHGFVGVVGESHYQDALKALASRLGPDGIFRARLMPEPDNVHDANAVAVCAEDTLAKLGFLPRGVAKSYHAKLALSPKPVACPARLAGVSAGNIGIVLDFEEVRTALGIAKVSVDRSEMDYEAAAEYHRINHLNRTAVKEARPLEVSDPEEAVRRYRQALAQLSKCRELAEAKGLTAYGFLLNQTDATPVDRLVRCLMKLRRPDEALAALKAFLFEFPHASEMTLLKGALARVERMMTTQRSR